MEIFLTVILLGSGAFAVFAFLANRKQKDINPVDDIQRENMRNLYGDNTK